MRFKDNKEPSTKNFLLIACVLTIFIWLKFTIQTTVKILTDISSFHWSDFILNIVFSSLLTWGLFYFNWRFNNHIAEQIKDYVKLFRKNPYPMWVYDLNTLKFLTVNESAIALYGYTEEEFRSMTIKDIRPLEDVPLLISASEKARLNFNHAYHWSGTWRHKLKSGQTLYVEISSHDIIFDGKKAELVLAYNVTEKVLQDHTLQGLNLELEKKVMERTGDLLQLNKRLVDQNRMIKSANLELYAVTQDLKEANQKIQKHADMKNRFVSMASHEFRNPLANISSSAGFIQRYYHKAKAGDILERAQTIDRHVTNMLALLDDVLTIGKTDDCKFAASLHQINIEAFITRVIQEVETAAKGSHKVLLTLHKDVASCINSDEKFLRNIFINLLSNAIKYSPGSRTVRLDITPQQDTICFLVRDQGLGITTQDIDRIFEPFYRCHKSENIAGTGLGLSIVKRAADALNAKIKVESEIGKGSTFMLLHPAA